MRKPIAEDELDFAKKKLQTTTDTEATEYLQKYIGELEREKRSNSKSEKK